MRSGPTVRFLQGLALGLAGAALVSWCLTTLIPANATTAGFFFLIVVLATATSYGLAAAAVTSAAATLAFNYFFLPPVGQFRIADTENWVALFTFLLTALVASHLSDRVRTQAAEARESQQETERLYALSRAILLADANQAVGPQVAQSIARVFDAPYIALFDPREDNVAAGGPAEPDFTGAPIESLLRNVVRTGDTHRDAAGRFTIWPISLGGRPMAAMAAAGWTASDGAIQSTLNLAAIALERARAQSAANQAEAALRGEEFKSTLLDSIAHEFKTPLTSIKAAATGMDPAALSASQRELVSIIDEETDRLTRLVTEAVQMAGIDAGKLAPQRSMTGALPLIHRAIDSFGARAEGRIVCEPGPAASVFVDAGLIVLALRQVLDNALKYTGAASVVRCSVRQNPTMVTIRIADEGPGVPAPERERIFEKFYRQPGVRAALPGTGMGLHIAREIARAHGGDFQVEANQPRGAVFCLTLPVGAAA